MKEPKGYRETLEFLNEKVGGKTWLSVTEISRVMGIDRSTVNRRFGIHKGCGLPILAMKICEETK